jgi:mannitol-1-/sugar-/sorbitol-6-/2-deoxyglucose-6-phosphatase
MISAVIFDMDGLLVDSEPLWRRAEIAAFAEVGVPLTETLCLETTGLRIDQVVEHWGRRFGFTGKTHAELRRDILDRVAALITSEAHPLPGAREAVERAAAELPIALASSSPHAIIDAVLARFSIRDRFRVIHSADEEPYGKPHPVVFLSTAARLGVNPVDCLVLEDSFNGVLAAKSARMRCVAVPEAAQRGDPRFVIADRILSSLVELDDDTWRDLLA